MRATEAKRLKTLKEENPHLKRLVTLHALNPQHVMDFLRKFGDARAAANDRRHCRGLRRRFRA